MTEQISKLLETRIDAGDFPSAVYLIAERGEIVNEDALGFAVVEPKKIEAKIDTVYDLASLTKVLVTGLLCAKLLEDGDINLGDKISKFFDAFDSGDKTDITIKNLLTHTSGFRGWLPFYLITKNGDAESIISEIAKTPLENPIDSKVVYSDLNFLLLGFLVEKLFEKTLDKVAKDAIFEPLNLRRTFFNLPENLRKQTAASEKGNAFERQTCIDLGFLEPSINAGASDRIRNSRSTFRNRIIWGEVHDNNCYYLNGIAGHAGLFSNSHEAFEIAKQFLPVSSELLKSETCAMFRKNFTPGSNQARSLAFQLAETMDSTAGKELSKDSFGHLGFTGTSLWIDPQKERIYILLTNRTHDRDLPLADLKETRQEFHRISSDILDGG